MFRSLLSVQVRRFRTAAICQKAEDKRQMLKSMPKRDEGVHGERAAEIDATGFGRVCDFPTTETADQLFDNIPFKMLPIVHIRSTKNNTLLQLTTADGVPLYNRSCGMDGFRNCRKSTNIAAQITASAFGKIIAKMGYQTCRVCINGIGPGRMSSFKGLQLAGINIVSITDSTFIEDIPSKRPRAAKSL